MGIFIKGENFMAKVTIRPKSIEVTSSLVFNDLPTTSHHTAPKIYIYMPSPSSLNSSDLYCTVCANSLFIFTFSLLSNLMDVVVIKIVK